MHAVVAILATKTIFLPSIQTAYSKGKDIQLYPGALEITPVNQLHVNKNTILPNRTLNKVKLTKDLYLFFMDLHIEWTSTCMHLGY